MSDQASSIKNASGKQEATNQRKRFFDLEILGSCLTLVRLRPESSRGRPGYILLITVLMIGMIAVATTVALRFLGWMNEITSFTASESNQALANAQTCVERAILNLRTDMAYVGRETATLSSGTCSLKEIQGSGNENRIICAEGTAGSAVRRLEIVLQRAFPSARVESWREVSAFQRCP
jgi:hypothetical protein